MATPPVYRCCQPSLLLDAVEGDRTVFLELAQIFRQETVARFEDIARASAAGMLNDMGFEAHSLKGTVGTVGAAGLVVLLQRIEHAGLKQVRACTALELAQLRHLLQLARDDMDTFATML